MKNNKQVPDRTSISINHYSLVGPCSSEPEDLDNSESDSEGEEEGEGEEVHEGGLPALVDPRANIPHLFDGTDHMRMVARMLGLGPLVPIDIPFLANVVRRE